MGLKELGAWNLLRMQHVPGDRREYFTTPDDIWVIIRTLAEERRKREIEPTLSLLRDTLLEHPASKDEEYAQGKMREMHEVIEMLTGWYSDVQKLETERLVQLLKLGSKVSRLYEAAGNVLPLARGSKRAAGKHKELSHD
jgi:DNA-binding transcriptional regulator GbsR (MarR family)